MLKNIEQNYWIVMGLIFVLLCFVVVSDASADGNVTPSSTPVVLPGVTVVLPTSTKPQLPIANNDFILPLPSEIPEQNENVTENQTEVAMPTPTQAPGEEVTPNQTNESPQNSIMSGYAAPLSQYIPNQTALPYYPGVLHIENGGCVPLNSTVDVSSFGWGVPEISWGGSWYDGFAMENISDLYDYSMPDTPSLLQNFFISPVIFGSRQGFWYANYGQQQYVLNNGVIYVPEAAANDRFFFVNMTCPAPVKNPYMPVTVTQTNATPLPEPFLPMKKTSDVVLAVGDSVTLNQTGPSHWWMFGYQAGQYIPDTMSKGNETTLDSTQWNLMTGDYLLETVTPGANNIYEEYFDPAYKPSLFNSTYPALVSPFRTGKVININGLNPQNVDVALHVFVENSIDDGINTTHVQYMEPEVDLGRLDIIEGSNNSTWMDVRGWTNLANGTQLSVTIDAGYYFWKQNKTYPVSAMTVSGDPGVWREYSALFPIDYNDMFPGPHNITVSAPDGASITSSFYRYILPANSYVPPQTISYIGASPFIPPVTVTVTVPVPGPTQYVDRPIPPTQMQIDAAAWKEIGWILEDIAAAVLSIIALFLLGRYLYRVHRRRKWQKE